MDKITIIGLGPAYKNQQSIDPGTLQGYGKIFLQTERHPFAAVLRKSDIPFEALDKLYDEAEDFDALNAAISDLLAGSAVMNCAFLVLGSGISGLACMEAIQKKAIEKDIDLAVIPGVSAESTALAAALRCGLNISASPYCCGAATDQMSIAPNTDMPLVIYDIDSGIQAGELKLYLMRYYGEMQEMAFLPHSEHLPLACRIKLYELDRQHGTYGHNCMLVLPAVPFEAKEKYDWRDLLKLMQRLRRIPDGCPWDREQNHDSLRRYLIEECYEVLDAIDKKDDGKLCEELGDVLLQVVFHAQVADELGNFDAQDITTGICKKMISRHTHIFGDVKADNSKEVLQNWERIKSVEKGIESHTGLIKDIPECLPALIRAYKVQKKAAAPGFDWADIGPAYDKIVEEIDELKHADTKEDADEELGDLLFACVNVARKLDIEPELALRASTEKFINRFAYIENRAVCEGRSLEDMSLDEMDKLWEESKRQR